MGWLWGSSDSSSAKTTLDPSLRDFLEKEDPTGPKPSLPSKPSNTTATSSSKAPSSPSHAQSPSTQPITTTNDATSTAVPPQSHFQDGRYAHLWKSYVPQAELEHRGKSEQDKLRDIVDSYNDRKAEIGRVALENCALEYMAQFECFRKPNLWQTATVCNAESRTFNRCYDVQSKFLKALGYLTMGERSAEESERIQMHADRLYQQMLEQEAAIEKAKEEGREPPRFESVLSKGNVERVKAGAAGAAGRSKSVPGPVSAATAGAVAQDDDEKNTWEKLKPEAKAKYEKLLAEVPAGEREFERKALLAELKAQTSMAKQVEETFLEERVNRMKRREAGQATLGDTIKYLWGWG